MFPQPKKHLTDHPSLQRVDLTTSCQDTVGYAAVTDPNSQVMSGARLKVKNTAEFVAVLCGASSVRVFVHDAVAVRRAILCVGALGCPRVARVVSRSPAGSLIVVGQSHLQSLALTLAAETCDFASVKDHTVVVNQLKRIVVSEDTSSEYKISKNYRYLLRSENVLLRKLEITIDI